MQKKKSSQISTIDFIGSNQLDTMMGKGKENAGRSDVGVVAGNGMWVLTGDQNIGSDLPKPEILIQNKQTCFSREKGRLLSKLSLFASGRIAHK